MINVITTITAALYLFLYLSLFYLLLHTNHSFIVWNHVSCVLLLFTIIWLITYLLLMQVILMFTYESNDEYLLTYLRHITFTNSFMLCTFFICDFNKLNCLKKKRIVTCGYKYEQVLYSPPSRSFCQECPMFIHNYRVHVPLHGLD